VNLEGKGEITIRDLLRNALHMRPDRIIVGECRGGEALDMIQAMSIGHEGSLSTGHANTPDDMLRRIETMVLMSGVDLPLRTIREQITAAVDIIVHTARLKDGTRKVLNITEVYAIEDDVILTQDIFRFEHTGMRDGRVQGELRPTAYRPTFMSRFAASGVALPPGEFGIPSVATRRRTSARLGKGRWVVQEDEVLTGDVERAVGAGRTVRAGGMVYVSGVGPIDRTTGIVIPGAVREQTRQGLRNLQAILEAEGTSLDKVVWANWSLRETSDYDDFIEEWNRWFPDGSAIGQETLMPPVQRRAGFRVCFGVIAQA
jgi:enamine deaminase RidA (YjgF/YER057c/UK114 family)